MKTLQPNYNIIRFYRDGRSEVVRQAVNIREAQEWTLDYRHSTKSYFDGYVIRGRSVTPGYINSDLT